jgi:putative ABC transport system permease protein
MSWLRFFRRRFWHEERARELQAHVEIETDENIAAGMPAEEARYAAERRLGNLTQIREEIYTMNTVGFLETILQDLRYATRQIRHSPAFSSVAVLTLALGIGAVTVMYSVIRYVLLDPFPYADSSRMVDVLVRDRTRPDVILRGALPVDEFLDYREQSHVFEEVIGALGESVIWTSKEGAEPFAMVRVTPNTFTFLGVPPLIGRALGPADARPDAPAVAVLSHRAWQGRFGGDPAVVGRTIVLSAKPRTVVGVMPPRFEWHVADAWVTEPLERGTPATPTTSRWFQARLKPGVTLAQAEAELGVIAARRAREHPEEYPKPFRIEVIHVIDFVVGRYRTVLYTLFAAVGLLLLIACSNVASMLLARANAREGEMTLRAALGASRARIVRQLLVESLLLALAAAALGSLLAFGGVQALIHVMPQQNVPRETVIRLDRPVLIFCVATAVLSTFVFGLVPAVHSVRRDLLAGLRQGGKGLAGGFTRGGARNTLVVAQVALSLVLLLGAGLLMRTFLALVNLDLGFDTANVVGVPFAFPEGQYEATAQKQAFARQAVERVRALPGVVAAADMVGFPPPFDARQVEFSVPERLGSQVERTMVRFCSEDYVGLMGLKLARGRLFSPEDVRGARRVAIINESLVRAAFNDRDPLGRYVTLSGLARLTKPVENPTFEIVGVLRDFRNSGVRDAASPEVLVPATLWPGSVRTIVARTSMDAALMLETIRREMKALDRGIAVRSGGVLDDEVRDSFHAQPRFVLLVLSAFAATGLVLVAMGIYGVLAYTVSRQRREIAVRIALGADRFRVLGFVVGLGMRLVLGGLLVGVAASAFTNRLLAHQLWNTTPHDPLTLAAGVGVILLVGLAACYVPAARAIRVEPMAVLRSE